MHVNVTKLILKIIFLFQKTEIFTKSRIFPEFVDFQQPPLCNSWSRGWSETRRPIWGHNDQWDAEASWYVSGSMRIWNLSQQFSNYTRTSLPVKRWKTDGWQPSRIPVSISELRVCGGHTLRDSIFELYYKTHISKSLILIIITHVIIKAMIK